jgi:hypothetical protein
MFGPDERKHSRDYNRLGCNEKISMGATLALSSSALKHSRQYFPRDILARLKLIGSIAQSGSNDQSCVTHDLFRGRTICGLRRMHGLCFRERDDAQDERSTNKCQKSFHDVFPLFQSMKLSASLIEATGCQASLHCAGRRVFPAWKINESLWNCRIDQHPIGKCRSRILLRASQRVISLI